MFNFIRQYFATALTPAARTLHYFILGLVLVQILLSNGMKISDDGVISDKPLAFAATWAHISIGLLLLLLTLIFIAVEFRRYGVRYFYPYLFGDVAPLKADLKSLLSFKLPEATPKGLAASIQGLGLGALLITVLAGAAWFWLWSVDSSWANDARNLHKTLTGLLIAYVIGHGAMGILHMALTYKRQK